MRRAAIVVGVVAVAAVGFVLARSAGDSSTDGQASAPTAPAVPATTTTGRADRAPAATTTTPARPPAPRVPRIVVRDGAPAGGVRTLRFRSGETIRFVVAANRADEVHVHGYDVARPVGPGAPARFAMPAEIEGIFEVELHGSGAQIASIVVEP